MHLRTDQQFLQWTYDWTLSVPNACDFGLHFNSAVSNRQFRILKKLYTGNWASSTATFKWVDDPQNLYKFAKFVEIVTTTTYIAPLEPRMVFMYNYIYIEILKKIKKKTISQRAGHVVQVDPPLSTSNCRHLQLQNIWGSKCFSLPAAPFAQCALPPPHCVSHLLHCPTVCS